MIAIEHAARGFVASPWLVQIAMLPVRRTEPDDSGRRPCNEDRMAHNNEMIMDCLHEHKTGLTIVALVELTGLYRVTVARRLKALEADGIVKQKNINKKRHFVVAERL